jgi:hypothetical protein
MNETILTKQSQAILDKLQKADPDPFRHLTQDEVDRVREALRLSESYLLVFSGVRRFIIGLAAIVVAVSTVFNFWPWSNK